MESTFVTTFVKIVSNDALPQYPVLCQEENDIATENINAEDINFCKHFAEQVTFRATNGTEVLLYAVRYLFIYVVSIKDNSKSDSTRKCKIFESSILLFQYLLQNNFFTSNYDQLKKLFDHHKMLKLRKIAKISGGKYSIIKLPAYFLVEEKDITTITIKGDISNLESIPYFPTTIIPEIKDQQISFDFSIIPCLHENRIALEIFIESQYVSETLQNSLYRAGFKKYSSNFSPPKDLIESWASRYKV